MVRRLRVPYDRGIVRRFLAPFILIVLVAVGLSACDVSVSPGAARIGSETISKASLNDAIHAVASDRALLCESSGTATYGAGSGTVGSGFAATQLTHLIQQRLIAGVLAKLALV